MASRDEDAIQTKVNEIAKAALDDEAKGQYLTGRQTYWHTTVSDGYWLANRGHGHHFF